MPHARKLAPGQACAHRIFAARHYQMQRGSLACGWNLSCYKPLGFVSLPASLPAYVPSTFQ